MPESYEFIDCSSVNISYNVNGLATVSMTVVSTFSEPGLNPPRDYSQNIFGNIEFKGFITQLDSAIIPQSVPPVFEHRFQISAVGCAVDCPRGPTRPV